jgi:hypothetical protein
MKKRIIDNWRVGVWPETRFNSRDPKQIAEDIKKSIERHIDDVAQVYLACDDKDICSFCKSEWEEDETGCPVCCNAAVKEWDTAHPAPGKEERKEMLELIDEATQCCGIGIGDVDTYMIKYNRWKRIRALILGSPAPGGKEVRDED